MVVFRDGFETKGAKVEWSSCKKWLENRGHRSSVARRVKTSLRLFEEVWHSFLRLMCSYSSGWRKQQERSLGQLCLRSVLSAPPTIWEQCTTLCIINVTRCTCCPQVDGTSPKKVQTASSGGHPLLSLSPLHSTFAGTPCYNLHCSKMWNRNPPATLISNNFNSLTDSQLGPQMPLEQAFLSVNLQFALLH